MFPSKPPVKMKIESKIMTVNVLGFLNISGMVKNEGENISDKI